ncbi:hypothetical protein C8J56DRAFT_1003660 [Mycena floridula]|nr:hypothetical protein C8J56DRAFT_1003660 [Mycena floridula]
MAITYLLLLLVVQFNNLIHGSTISTSTPVPPLQWINLVTTGTKPPPLKDASIGYDDSSRTLILFGGLSESGFAQSQTFLLNLDTLTWSFPSPAPNLPTLNPTERSAAISGCDFAASNRHGFIVIGGLGNNNNPLSDIWEYDFINQFWTQINVSPGGPSPRYGAAGGIDIRTAPQQDRVVPGPNNTFYYAGGYDGSKALPLSDVWRLSVSGTLSSNLPHAVSGSWEFLNTSTLPSRVDIASTVLFQQIVAAGGCSTLSNNDSCATGDSYIINTQTRTANTPGSCPAPRKGASLIPNLNTNSASFATQVFLLLGTFDQSEWSDDGALEKGEVDILDVDTGTWSRILPSGDPGTSGHATYPVPREGAAVISSPGPLVGSSRESLSDTMIFGGRDSSGKYLDDIWVLRSYGGVITPSNQHWTGFGNGVLQTGIGATGAGVTSSYITECAAAISTPTTTSSSSSSSGPATATGSPDSSTSGTPSPFSSQTTDTSRYHKIFAPLSLALLLPSALLFRMFSASGPYLYLSTGIALVAYGMGIAGLVTSFMIIQSSLKRSLPSNFTTLHGRAGLAFAIGLYGVVPAFFIASLLLKKCRIFRSEDKVENIKDRTSSAEKVASLSRRSASAETSAQNPSRPVSPRPRTHSWGPSSLFRLSNEGRSSSDSESNVSSGPHRGFEVTNRSPRRQLAPSDAQSRPLPRNLSDVDWLQRRRSLNAVGELDYAISQVYRTQQLPPTPATIVATPKAAPSDLPSGFDVALHFLFHAFLIALCVISLTAFWTSGSTVFFSVFLVWTLGFYLIIVICAYHGRPAKSLFTVLLLRLRTQKSVPPPDLSVPSSPLADERYPFPNQGPYYHQPAFRATEPFDGPRSAESPEEDEEEEEEVERQMDRREVSIVTVPKRRLWIVNPSNPS